MQRTRTRLLLALGAIALICAVLLPGVLAVGFGRLIGDLWVTAMSAVAGLVGSMFAR